MVADAPDDLGMQKHNLMIQTLGRDLKLSFRQTLRMFYLYNSKAVIHWFCINTTVILHKYVIKCCRDWLS